MLTKRLSVASAEEKTTRAMFTKFAANISTRYIISIDTQEGFLKYFKNQRPFPPKNRGLFYLKNGSNVLNKIRVKIALRVT